MGRMTETAALAEKLKRLADALGMDALGFASASEFEGYLLASSQRRDPRLSLPSAQTIIVAGIYIGGVILPGWDEPSTGRTSRLFLSGFFNDVVQQMEPLASLLREAGYAALICDDSSEQGSIVPLKLAAIRAGLGWQGKNSLLLSQKFGTFLALGGIVTDAPFEHHTGEAANRCGTCTMCQQACPTRALEQAHVLNRARCLSHLLQHDDLPEAVWPVIGNRVMDCEICQQVCPWNARHLEHPLDTAMTTSFQKEIPGWEAFFALSRLAKLTAQEYAATLGPLNTGIPFPILHRNILLAVAQWQPR